MNDYAPRYIHMVVTITFYGEHYIKPRCYFQQSVDDDDDPSFEYISLEKAQQLMWELVKAGGTREYRMNSLDPSICTARATYWARH